MHSSPTHHSEPLAETDSNEQAVPLPLISDSPPASLPKEQFIRAEKSSSQMNSLPHLSKSSFPASLVPEREIVLTAVRPPYRVNISIDKGESIQAGVGLRFPVSSDPHILYFTCVNDLCQSQKHIVPPGKMPENVQISLEIKPL
ncbi:hypothetical protein [Pajaroellobacter abortibovis]|uniref:Uncharacterized protein n=1 Tax=Pajaroellobacter abortibovis TaxID=1882918 RepID=A0A1L6MVE2_9BACT|nr:hypothetical protein [Pajaroellobacter abortibovis]APR99492.1 hypothetical protein BCY86_01440 [Pajaroellobacter abortibovis]